MPEARILITRKMRARTGTKGHFGGYFLRIERGDGPMDYLNIIYS
jgi:hypothetical protein